MDSTGVQGAGNFIIGNSNFDPFWYGFALSTGSLVYFDGVTGNPLNTRPTIIWADK